MRQFEQLFLESMAEAAPKRYAAMQEDGTLAMTARTLAERAQAQYEHALAERMRADPGPKDSLARAASAGDGESDPGAGGRGVAGAGKVVL